MEKAAELSGLSVDLAARRKGNPGESCLRAIVVDRERIVQLNTDFLGREQSTDVLAFDLRPSLPEEPAWDLVGEIYVCFDVAVEAAAVHGTTASYEVLLYIVHGMLHLCGQDDHTEQERGEMRRKENQIMECLEEDHDIGGIFGE